jgi:hypothetical protein
VRFVALPKCTIRGGDMRGPSTLAICSIDG